MPDPKWPPIAAEVPVGHAVGSLDLGELARESVAQVVDRYRDDHALYSPGDSAQESWLHPAFPNNLITPCWPGIRAVTRLA